VRIPNEEHRTFHLTVFKRLDNPFVMGILEAYWDAYNAVELNRYSDYSYLQQVWSYHEQIFEAICAGNFDQAKKLFIDHTNLIRFQPRMQRIHATAEPENE
jgi:DNA-binding GntR family transcriptional regulator